MPVAGLEDWMKMSAEERKSQEDDMKTKWDAWMAANKGMMDGPTAGVGKTKRGKGSKIMAIADRQGRPVAVHVESATPHEVTLVHATLASGLSGSSRCV